MTQGPSAHGQLERVDRFSFGNLNGGLGINKKKALDYLQTSAPIAVSSSSQELSSNGKDTDNSETSPNKLTEELQGSHYHNLAFVLFGVADMEFLLTWATP